MTGPLKCASGTAAAPGVTFSSDLDTGFYRASSDTIGVAAGGTQVGSIDSTGFKPLSGSYDKFPSGTRLAFQQTSAPTGWTKDTTHNDKALRVVSGTASSGGSTAFSSVFTSKTITVSNLPDITVTSVVTDPGHLHTYTNTVSGGVGDGNQETVRQTTTTSNTSTATTGITVASSFGTSERGGSQTAIDFAVAYVDLILAEKD